MSKTKTYSEILEELETLVDRMDRGEIPVDELGDAVKTAARHLKTLRTRLKTTETQVTEILRDLEEEREE